MLKNFLPFLQHLQVLIKKQNPKLPEQNQSPNLLYSTGDKSIADNLSKPPLLITSFLFKLILIVQGAFLLVFIVNFLLNVNLFILNRELSGLSSKILSFSDLVAKTQKIVDKTILYKTSSDERLPHGKYIAICVSGAENAVNITTLKSNAKIVSISASAASPINFSVLLNNYFTNKEVSSVVLKTASLDTRENVFRMEIDVEFK